MGNVDSLKRVVAHAAAGISLLALAASASAMPSYAPVGPQNNIPFATVLSGGWTECFSQPYGTSGPSISSALSGCTGDLLMMAGASNGSTDIQLLAWAPLVDVVLATAANTVHNANGTGWYRNDSLSWGFAPQGFPINQTSADTNSAPGFGTVGDSGDQRLSWHVNAGNLNGGWRVGNQTFLNSEPSGYTRYLFTAESTSVPEPETIVLLGLGLALAGAIRRHRAA